jgi:NADPH:quinone reductase-like Zn-dependent oxidoreductase
VSLIEKGTIVPVVDRSYPLEEICEAQRQFLEKKHIGKIVLQVNTETENSDSIC